MPFEESKKAKKIEALIVITAAAWSILLCVLGINPVDGAVQMFYGYMISKGLVAYRDFFLPIPPLPYLIQAGMIKIFGLHLITAQLWAALQGLVAVMVALRICRRHLEYPFFLIPAVLYIPYSISLGGFPHYNADSWFYLLICLALLDEYLHRQKRSMIFGAGLFASFAILSKHSMIPVVFFLVLTALLMRVDKKRPRKILADLAGVGLGIFLPVLVLFIRYAHAHALEEVWANLTGMSDMKRLVLVSFLPRAVIVLGLGLALVRIIMEISRRRPRLAGALWGAAISGCVVFIITVPVLVSGTLALCVVVVSLFIFVRPGPGQDHKSWMLIRACGLLFFVFNVLSGMDLAHLLIASAGAVFPAGLLFQNLWHESRQERGIISTRAVALIGLLLVLVFGVWLDLAIPHLSFVQQPKYKSTSKVRLKGLEFMRASGEQAHELEATVKWIVEHSAPEDKIFVYPWDLLIYVLSERLPATYHTYFYYEIFDHKTLGRLIADLEKNRPGIIVLRIKGDRIDHVALAGEATAIESYIKRHYESAARFGTYKIMTRTIADRIKNADATF